MRGKICLITGANSGLGKATASELAKMGSTVIMVCRNEGKGEAAMSQIKKESRNDLIDLLIADLSSTQSVRQAADEFRKRYSNLHVLINNAGLFNIRRYVTAEGYERTFAVNYLSTFLLTNLLLERLKVSAPSRVVNVSSVAHYGGHINFGDLQGMRRYSGFTAYSQSKLAMILFTRELATKLQGTGVTAYSLHPGAVATNIGSRPAGPLGFVMKLSKLFMASPEKGAETIVYLASSPDVEGASGEYFEKKKVRRSSEESYDLEQAGKLWKVSRQLTHIE